jgi:hypothetical protein
VEIADGLVCFLVRNRISLKQMLPARSRDFRQLQIRLGILQIGPRLLQLLVKFWRFNGGQKLAFSYTCADVHVPVLNVAARPRVDGSVIEADVLPGNAISSPSALALGETTST